jgi:hypothetical protein
MNHKMFQKAFYLYWPLRLVRRMPLYLLQPHLEQGFSFWILVLFESLPVFSDSSLHEIIFEETPSIADIDLFSGDLA